MLNGINQVSAGNIKIDRRRKPGTRRSELFLAIMFVFLILLFLVFLIGDISYSREIRPHTILAGIVLLVDVCSSVIARISGRYKVVTIIVLLMLFNVAIPAVAASEQNFLYLGLVIVGFLVTLVGFESQAAILYPALTLVEYIILFAVSVIADIFSGQIPFELVMVLFVICISGFITMLIYHYFIQLLNQKIQENHYLSEVNRELLSQSNQDSLTGLMNRRHYNKVIKHVVAAFDYLHTPFSLIMLDIDHFKVINDTYGHENGDLVLKELSLVLQKAVRNDDVVCRMGGEEFAIVLQTDIQTAAKRAELIRAAVEAMDVRTVGRFTISLGVATYRAGMSEEDIYVKADDMLYQAKNGGRNRVCVDWS